MENNHKTNTENDYEELMKKTEALINRSRDLHLQGNMLSRQITILHKESERVIEYSQSLINGNQPIAGENKVELRDENK